MSSSVSPRQRDIGEVASLRAEGVDRQPRSGFSAKFESRKVCEAATLILAEPLRLWQLLRFHFQQHTTLSQKTRLIAQIAEVDIVVFQPFA